MTPLIIAGFHRSGTSAVARSLALAGLHLGDDLLGSEPSNPHGHFEDNEVIDIHQTLLDVNGCDWKVRRPFDPYVPDRTWRAMEALLRRRRARGRPWGFKDPRVCLFLSLWLHLEPEARVLVVYRRPAEAIRSLHMRHSLQMVVGKGRGEVHRDFWKEPDLGARMWLAYHRTLLDSLPTPARTHVLDFGDRGAVGPIVETLNRRWDLGLDEDHDEALDPDLGHARVDPVGVRDPVLAEEIDAVWAELRRHTAQTEAAIAPT